MAHVPNEKYENGTINLPTENLIINVCDVPKNGSKIYHGCRGDIIVYRNDQNEITVKNIKTNTTLIENSKFGGNNQVITGSFSQSEILDILKSFYK